MIKTRVIRVIRTWPTLGYDQKLVLLAICVIMRGVLLSELGYETRRVISLTGSLCRVGYTTKSVIIPARIHDYESY